MSDTQTLELLRAELKQSSDSTRASFEDATKARCALAVSVARVEERGKGMVAALEQINDTIHDHETRIQSVEITAKKVGWISGIIATVFSVTVAVVVKQFFSDK